MGRRGAPPTHPKEYIVHLRSSKRRATIVAVAALAGAAGLVSQVAQQANASAKAPPGFANRLDIRFLPDPLKNRLIDLAGQKVSFIPQPAFSEAPGPSQLFQYYLLDNLNFQPNVFSAANGPSTGAVRVVLEPKPGLPTNPNNVRAGIDTFTDISGLPVINNEAGFYEAWMIHDLRVPKVAPPRPDGHAQFGTITAADAQALAQMGSGHNQPGVKFTMDGNQVRLPAATDLFGDPARQTNVVPVQISVGTFNASQRNDTHPYWEFNPGTDWAFPTYELAATGGTPGSFQAGQQYSVSSLIPGDGPTGEPIGEPPNSKITFGDNPNNPRDPDRKLADDPANPESRLRFIPSGLADEVLQDVFARPMSFEPGVTGNQRLFDAYASEVARVDQNDDGVISFNESNVDASSDGLPNSRLFLPAPTFDRFAVSREINTGLLAPRFAPSQRAWVLSGSLTTVNPPVPASIPSR
jgi:hypothetical protein